MKYLIATIFVIIPTINILGFSSFMANDKKKNENNNDKKTNTNRFNIRRRDIITSFSLLNDNNNNNKEQQQLTTTRRDIPEEAIIPMDPLLVVRRNSDDDQIPSETTSAQKESSSDNKSSSSSSLSMRGSDKDGSSNSSNMKNNNSKGTSLSSLSLSSCPCFTLSDIDIDPEVLDGVNCTIILPAGTVALQGVRPNGSEATWIVGIDAGDDASAACTHIDPTYGYTTPNDDEGPTLELTSTEVGVCRSILRTSQMLAMNNCTP